MPSLYRMFLSKIIFDLKSLKTNLDSSPINYSDLCYNTIKQMEFLYINQQSILNLKLDLIKRIQGLSKETQLYFINKIIVFLELNIDTTVETFENKFLKNITFDSDIEADKIEIDIINKISSDKRYTFFGPIEYINIYKELSDKLKSDLFDIYTNITNDVTDKKVYKDIKNISIPLFYKDAGEYIKDNIISCLKNIKIVNLKTALYLLTTKLNELEKIRIDIINESINDSGKRDASAETLNLCQKTIIENIFIADGFMTC